MSAEAHIWAAERRAGDPLARFVLLTLAGAADDAGYVDVPREFLERATEMTLREFEMALDRLRARGLVAFCSGPRRWRLQIDDENAGRAPQKIVRRR